MQPYKYKAPRINAGELRTRVTFYELIPSKSPLPDAEDEKKILYSCWAKVESVWSKDIEVAKGQGTLSDLTISIHDTKGEFIPDNTQLIEVEAPEYAKKVFNAKEVMPDLQNRGFVKIVAEVHS